MKCLWKCEFSCLVESAVEVFAKKTGSVVACHHSIWVQHRNNIENERSTQLLGDWICTGDEFKQAFSDKGRVRFSWMDAASNKNYFLIILCHFVISNL